MNYISDVQEQVSNTLFDTIKFSLYPNCLGIEKIRDISLTDIFQSILTPYSEDILFNLPWALKELNSESRNDDPLKEIKRGIPAITPHGVFFSGQKSNNKLETLSGLLYVDIDFKHTGQDPKEIKKALFSRPEIIACWTTLSCQGVAGLAALDNIPNNHNFHSYHLHYLKTLAKELNITEGWFDETITNFQAGCAIPYDPNLLVKSSFKSLYLDFAETAHYRKDKTSIHLFRQRAVSASLINTDSEDFMYEVELTSYPHYLPDGHIWFRAYIPYDKDGRTRKILAGKRNLVLSTYVHNLIILNPNKSSEDFIKKMLEINEEYCIPKLSHKEIYQIVWSKLKDRNKLKPIKPEIKKWWTTPPSATNRMEAYREFRKQIKWDNILEFMSQLDNFSHKITDKFIAQECGISLITVRRTLTPEMKLDIKTHNAKFVKQRKRTKTTRRNCSLQE